ncbi:thiopeptide-type bacteriocin biosynthesis protein [Actinocrispum wychmicini]|uniref:Thiopeptide-type bacteriocin biosynthesis protein n=1 Tax=Actinocrispum wychmicini TaxID=1213861 RepID=A0A4R2IN32_9PSEU|nr:thiopeptide-type bacteriocin biosynthesis protein [Actinocrispum wychmicini]TCO46434.1 thiopeptide-type bacteriocin biosynthesis protein [Actinocrispum wychmicini]
MDTSSQRPAWQQVAVEFADYAIAEQTAAVHLLPIMNRAEADGLVASWWFIRKAPWWRLRYLPPYQAAEAAARHALHAALDNMRDTGRIAGWIETIYEPEVHAFGGTDAMTIAHQLFHLDSRHILAYVGSGRDQVRELTVLLCSVLMRAARQDWYEQGGIWARIAENRPLSPATPPDQPRALESSLRRLMTVDAGPSSPLVGPDGTLAKVATWSAAFHSAGTALGELASRGTLRRGLRSVLAHHVIFHWNRFGLSYDTQSILARAAQEVVFGQ